MLVLLLLLVFTAGVSAIGPGPNQSVYTICGADRGYTERDSLEAAKYLEEKIIRSEKHPVPSRECAYAHVNTTVISVCNDSAENRTISKTEFRHGIDRLIKDCGLQGGFTGTHFAGNLSFSAYGITGAKVFYKSTRPRPVRPNAPQLGLIDATHRGPTKSHLRKRDCRWAYDGVAHTDCDWKNRIDSSTKKCNGEFTPQNDCQVFCELKRTGLLGVESRPGGAAAEHTPPGITPTLERGTEYSVTHGFSIGAEGVSKDAIGAGLSYQYSVTKTNSTSIAMQPEMKDSGEWWSRWIFFPKMLESCGTIGRKTFRAPANCMNDMCSRQIETGYVGEIENIENVCIMVPRANPDGTPSAEWALRFESGNGDPAPFSQQPKSYQSICKNPEKGDADGRDDDPECMNHIQP